MKIEPRARRDGHRVGMWARRTEPRVHWLKTKIAAACSRLTDLWEPPKVVRMWAESSPERGEIQDGENKLTRRLPKRRAARG